MFSKVCGEDNNKNKENEDSYLSYSTKLFKWVCKSCPQKEKSFSEKSFSQDICSIC